MQLRTPLVFPILLALLAGCAGQSISPQDRNVLEQPARALEARGEWREAAATWQRSAKTQQGDLAIEFQLNAADALLQAGDGPAATQIVQGVAQSIPPAQSIRRALILADASILDGDPVAALQRVGPGLTTTDRDLLARYRRTRADALEMTGDRIGASRERSLRDPLLVGSEEGYRNRQKIWSLLKKIPFDSLRAQLDAPRAQPPTVHEGWMELAAITRRNALDADLLDAAISDWSSRYPGHPAGEQIVPEVIEVARSESQPPRTVALLLPQTGPFATAARAIRDGFMAAWQSDSPNQNRPEIVLTDTRATGAAVAYRNAVSAGAQFVVGPLAKESVGDVIDNAQISVTTLALNYAHNNRVSNDPTASSDTRGTSNSATTESSASAPIIVERDLSRLYYFVLSPEDEARRAAEYAFQQGARQAAVLAADGPWGQRVGNAFAQHWRNLGGVIATTVAFPEEPQGLSEAIERLLNIGRSKARAKRLRAALVRNFRHEPQPRSDVDVIFMAAFPQAARQLRPLLQFHRAAKVPVLATSHVFAGIADPQSDLDLNGIVFGDMPWLITPDAHALPQQGGGTLGRLYALGADAYSLIARLRELRVAQDASFPGLTGTLSLDPTQRIRRDMQWSRFVEGIAQPVGQTTQADATTSETVGG